MKEAVLYKKQENSVKCLACSHYCVIKPNKRGICGVRKSINNKLYLLVYNKVASVNIDPIEKKPLYHYLPGTKSFSIGTVGCNFKCDFCQNFEISQISKGSEIDIFGRELSPTEIVNLALKNNYKSISYTYTEPTIASEYYYEIAKLAHKNKLKNIYVTNGYLSKESIKFISPYLDAANIDLKSFSNDFYKKYCGAKLDPVLKTIKTLHKLKKHIEITTLIIPELNDSAKELTQIAKFIKNLNKNISWHISRFFPMYKMQHFPQTPIRSLEKTYEIGKKQGLNYVYIGNISNEKYSSTYCPKCKKEIIKRQGYSVINNLKKNKCPFCKTKIYGVFE